MQSVIKFKHFDKYRFIKDFAATASDQSKREEKEREAEIIANAIEENEYNSSSAFENHEQNFATKHDLETEINAVRKDISTTEDKLRIEIKNAMLTTIISIGGIVVTAIGFVSWLFKMT